MQVGTIAEQLLFTTLRVETRSAAGDGTGTAFLFTHTHDGRSYPFVVTNRHVIRHARTGTVQFHKGVSGKLELVAACRIEVEDFEHAWMGHPDPDVDVAVMPLAPLLESMQQSGVTPFYRSISRELTLLSSS